MSECVCGVTWIRVAVRILRRFASTLCLFKECGLRRFLAVFLIKLGVLVEAAAEDAGDDNGIRAGDIEVVEAVEAFRFGAL